MAEGKSHYNQATIYELQKWLEHLCGDESCLILQPDKENLELLMDLKVRNEEAEKNIREEIKTKQNLIQFYNSKTGEMKKLIESEGVTLDDDSVKLSESLAALGAKMNLAEPDLTNFLMAIYDMKDQKLKYQEQKFIDCHDLSSLSQKVLNIQKQNKVLERHLEALEKTVEIQECNGVKLTKSLSFMELKRQDYERSCKKIEDSLNSKGYDTSLRHNILFEKSESIQALEEQYKKVSSHLESYKALPPNETLAKIEVEKKLEELNELEKSFSKLLESLQKDAHET